MKICQTKTTSPRKRCVDVINTKMIGHFHGVYHSFNYAVDNQHRYYPQEFLNTLTPQYKCTRDKEIIKVVGVIYK